MLGTEPCQSLLDGLCGEVTSLRWDEFEERLQIHVLQRFLITTQRVLAQLLRTSLQRLADLSIILQTKDARRYESSDSSVYVSARSINVIVDELADSFVAITSSLSLSFIPFAKLVHDNSQNDRHDDADTADYQRGVHWELL